MPDYYLAILFIVIEILLAMSVVIFVYFFIEDLVKIIIQKIIDK